MSTTHSILQLVRAKLENTRLSIQQQQKTLEACESRLKAMELEEQQCLARPIAAVEEEQQQAVNVRKMIEAYNEKVAKKEIEYLGKKALQEMRTLKRHVSQIQKIEKTITGLQDIGNAVQMDNTALEAEPHIQKADLSKENIPAIGDGREDILKATRLAAGEDDIQMATKNCDLTLPATNKNLFKPAKNGDLLSKKDATWHNIFKANMAGDGRKAAINEDPKGDAANNKDLLKPTKNRELNLKEDFPKDVKWHNIFKANMKEDSRRTDEDPSTATKGYQRLGSGKGDLGKSDLKNPATKEDLNPKEDFPKVAKWHDIFKANMTGDSLKPVQRAIEKVELAEPNPKDNESFDERNPEDLRRKVEEELLKASYYHKELRWLHDIEKMRSQIKEQNQREIEQKKREFEEKEITQKESYKEIQPVGEEPTYESSCSIDNIVTRSALHRPPRCKEMAVMRAEIIRSWHETKAMVEAAIAEKDQCIREIDEIEASLAAKKQEIRESDEMEEERKKAVQVSYTISSFSSGESHACPHRTLVGQYSPIANDYLVDQSPASVQPSVNERAARWLSPVASNVDSSPGDWRQLTTDLLPESIPEEVEEEDEDEEEEEEEDMASYMSQFRANGQIFSHLLMVTHILDGHLRVRLGQNYNDAGLLEVKRDATQMFEERREPTGNCLRWRQLAGKMVFLMSRMLQQYYDLVDAQIARFA